MILPVPPAPGPPADASPLDPAAILDPGGGLNVFAYGSLIWRPGFEPESRRPALLRGYHRRFCLRSTHYRGTPERPGLVLGLDRGGACRGVVLRAGPAIAREVLAYLDEREMLGGVYHRRLVRVRLLDGGGAANGHHGGAANGHHGGAANGHHGGAANGHHGGAGAGSRDGAGDGTGGEVRALAYVADRAAVDYCPGLDPAATAATIAAGIGVMGANRDYLLQTLHHLREMGVVDSGLERLAALLPPTS